jgi:hypothetical protein
MANHSSNNKSIDGIRVEPTIITAKHGHVRKFVTKQRRNILLGGGILIVGVIAGVFIFAHFQHSPSSGLTELKTVEAEVSRHYLLPGNEVPALATITNKNKITSPFFKGTKNGDEILIYEKNHLAIIYRPSIDRIVAVGPVNIVPQSSISTGN